jgi:hypothetical protein
MPLRSTYLRVGCLLVVSACSTDDGAPPREPKHPPALACDEQPLELPRPPTGGLPCELMPPGFTP